MSYLEELFSLSGRTAIVTGASRGIGHACANALADAGARCFGFARSTPEPVGRFEHVRCDIADEGALRAAIDSVADRHGRLDILVNAAGLTVPVAPNSTQDERLAQFDRTLSVNLRAAYVACEQAARHMRQAGGGGSIVNVTSIAGEFGFPGNPAYVASKGGLRLLTKALAEDLARDGIRVNNLAPGYVRTAMTEGSYGDPQKNEVRRRNMMLPRWGMPADFAGAVIYLAGPASAYVTGTDLYVDGGWSAKGMS